jgi:hypothetical protein
MIAGPTGIGKSMFVRRFVPNIKHMMTPMPDRILWCYGEYQMIGIVSVWNPPKKPDYWFSKYNRVLLHYSVSIAAAAATAAYIPLSAAAVYIAQSTAAATYTPRPAALRLFSRNTTVRVLCNTSNN